MISWMQKKHKYLVVTIWVSTIAFVGAGFVGWGAYSYGNKANAVAKVGDITITAEELQSTYSSLFNYYAQMFQGEFDQESAKRLGLETQAIKLLLDQTLLQNLAKKYEFRVLDSEIKDILLQSEPFFKDGKFDKKSYIAALKKIKLTPREYESRLKKELLLQKLNGVLNPSFTAMETSSVQAPFLVADKLNYSVISSSSIKVDENANKIKSFWEKRKEKYLSEKKYSVEYFWQNQLATTPTQEKIESHYEANKFEYKNSDGQIKPLEEAKNDVIEAIIQKATKKSALKQYILYKKGEIEQKTPIETAIITDINLKFPYEVMQSLMELKAGSYMKPKLVGDRFVVIKLLEVIEPKPKSFKNAYEATKVEYIKQTQKAELEKLAQKALSDFKGAYRTDFILKNEVNALTGLSTDETSEFLSRLFLESKPEGVVTLENKAIIYKILEQRLLDSKEEDRASSAQNALSMKKSMLNSGLLKELESSFAVDIYYKGQ